MKKCYINIFLLFFLLSFTFFCENLYSQDLIPIIKIKENITIGVYEEIDYRRDPLWGDTSTVAFTPGLEILANIEKANVYFYDEYSGITSYETDDLTSGQYRVKIVKTGYQTEEFSFFLDMSKRTVIKIELLAYTGELNLSGMTADTQIFANNVELPNTQRKVSSSVNVVVELPVGTNKIRLRRFGYKTVEFSIDISSKEAVQYDIIWNGSDPEILDFDILPRFGSFFTKNPQKIFFVAELNRPGSLLVNLLNEKDELIASSSLNGENPLEKGVLQTKKNLAKGKYTLLAQFTSRGKTVTAEKSFSVSPENLNRYQTTRSGISGLLFVPSAKTLYPNSYAFAVQGEGLYDFSTGEASIPLHFSGRFSPFLNLEGSVNVIFSFEPNTGDSFLDLSTGCKYNLSVPSDLFSMGMALRFTYNTILPEFTTSSTQDSYSNTTGAAFLVPIELQGTLFRLLFTPELNLVPFKLSNESVHKGYFEPFSGIDVYSTIRLGGEFHWKGLAIGLSGAFKTPGFVTGDNDWLSVYIGSEFGFAIPETILQINGLFFLELKQDGLETMGGGFSLGLLL